MALTALAIPRMSAYDPPSDGEGRLDPLGLATTADRLADTYARPLRARMRRIRFAAAMCLGALVTPELEGVEPAVTGDSPELAFERLVVEALARDNDTGGPRDLGIPGITKAHEAILAGGRLDARGYLKSPRVFGFHGVYRPLALSLGLVDARGGLLPGGRTILEAVALDQDLDGLLDPATGTPGGQLLEWLINETGGALRAGRNTFAISNKTNLPRVAALGRPSRAGRRERRALRSALDNPVGAKVPDNDIAFVEALELLKPFRPAAGWIEVDAVEVLTRGASAILKDRLLALVAFEDFARDLTWAFDEYRFLSSTIQQGLPTAAAIRAATGITSGAKQLPAQFVTVVRAFDTLADTGADPHLSADFQSAFAPFAESMSSHQLIEAIVAHHQGVQERKAPSGKRSWFDPVGDAWAIRPPYSLFDEPDRLESFIHPYRFGAMVSFLADLRG